MINKNKTNIEFAKYITKLRKQNNLTLLQVAKKANLDRASLHRIENGEIQKINPLFLEKLAELYDVNVLEFYLILGYVKEKDITSFSSILKNKNLNFKSQKLKIPVLKNKEAFLSDKYRSFLNITNSNNELLAFFSSKKFFIFKKTDILNKDDTGIFEIQGKIHIGKYAIKENFVFISDFISSDVFFRESSEISILGKVFYIIEVI
ncbi:helix-turn-helix domain-containing protein [Sebaldella sp. S0638]|uniref:helix-turn-helix domain-containing protein n=1 Tax=Sebaldella sp. S0638 TaxID=2957809 RepID=UPI0020A14989|nr:helix-turn-helix transcriptional regulator [Sebaldella sp. S0638]MCP1225768.1 helix-turn-helix transcriptional regulator [Sebaldella sp. S0638]